VTTPLLSLRGKLAVVTEPLRRARRAADGEREPDLGAFLAERIGDEAARVLAGAFVRGVYAAELDELGARSAFPRLWAMVQEHGGLVRGMLARRKAAAAEPGDAAGPALRRGALLSFEDGFGELPAALARSLGDALVLGRAVTRLERDGDGFVVTLADGERWRAAQVVLAVPARVAATLLEPATDAATVAPLAALRHARVTLVHLGFDAPHGTRLLPSGFGYLVPPGGPDVTGDDAPRALGTIFGSNLFAGRAPEGAAATTSFYRTGDIEQALGAGARDEGALTRLATEDLARGLGCAVPEPSVARVKAWDDVIPSYGPGHADAMATLEAALVERLPGVHLAGNFVGGVSVEQVVVRGRTTARAIAGRYDRRLDRPSGSPSATDGPARGIGARP
jgi:oxygen-dependent protoporphyrinogen oxidase